jgi:hypothetical protein
VLLHVVDGEQRRVDFPLEPQLLAIAAQGEELYVTGVGGAVYQCNGPGCDAADSAP